MGLSFGKLVVLAILIAIVWYGFKYAGRVQAVSRAMRREMEARRAGPRPAAAMRTMKAEDLVKCDSCGSYVAANSTSACGRADCPWGR